VALAWLVLSPPCGRELKYFFSVDLHRNKSTERGGPKSQINEHEKILFYRLTSPSGVLLSPLSSTALIFSSSAMPYFVSLPHEQSGLFTSGDFHRVLIIERIVDQSERKVKLQKLNMVPGRFFQRCRQSPAAGAAGEFR